MHCDAEIFEWLMTYIHEKDINPPKIDKSIIVSILISSDFLQMDALVEQCIQVSNYNYNMTFLEITNNNVDDLLYTPYTLYDNSAYSGQS